MNYPLPEWDGVIRDKRGGHGRNVLIMGKSGCGKSTLVKALLYVNHRKYYMAIGMSYVEGTCAEYRRCIPAAQVYDHFNEKKLDDVYEHMKNMLKFHEETLIDAEDEAHRKGVEVDMDAVNQRAPVPPQILVCLDDISDPEKQFSSAVYAKLCARGRHLGITTMFITQNLMDVKAKQRNNYQVFISPCNLTAAEHKRVYEATYKGAYTHSQYLALARELASLNPFTFMVFDYNRIKDHNPPVFYFIAPLHVPRFKIGMPDMWLLNHKYKKRHRKLTIERLIKEGMGIFEDTEGGAKEGEPVEGGDPGAQSTGRRSEFRAVSPTCDYSKERIVCRRPRAKEPPDAPSRAPRPAPPTEDVSSIHSRKRTAATAATARMPRRALRPITVVRSTPPLSFAMSGTDMAELHQMGLETVLE